MNILSCERKKEIHFGEILIQNNLAEPLGDELFKMKPGSQLRGKKKKKKKES